MKRILGWIGFVMLLSIVAAPSQSSGTAGGPKGAATPAEPLDVAVAGIKKDPLLLVGDYTPAKTEGAPVLVLLHGLGSTRAEWAPLIDAASARGWGAYAYDARGHGRSVATLSGAGIDYRDRRTAEKQEFWAAMVDDLKRVAQALETQKGVARGRQVFVGASLGANVALAAVSSGTAAGAVLLSPGLDYAGIGSETPMVQVEVPVLMVAAKPDLYSYTSVQRLEAQAPNDRRVDVWVLDQGTKAGAHGAQLFDGKLEKRVLDWVAGMSKPLQKSKPKR